MEWQDAERVALQALHARGFVDATLTPPGPDGGVDVDSRLVAAQVKATRQPVDRAVVQQIAGAAQRRRAAVFSQGGYTAPAVEWADRAGVALFTGSGHPVNDHARLLRAPVSGKRPPRPPRPAGPPPPAPLSDPALQARRERLWTSVAQPAPETEEERRWRIWGSPFLPPDPYPARSAASRRRPPATGPVASPPVGDGEPGPGGLPRRRRGGSGTGR